MSNELKLINMQDIKCENVEWLLYPFIPYDKITIIQGDPGEGKTTLVLQIIARLTKGESIIDEETKPPISVIYQTAEDGLGDTIKPRLVAANADCSKVLVIDDIAVKYEYDEDSAILLIEALYHVCCGAEPDDVISRLRLKDTVGIPVETILKVYKWIWGQEDCNYPTKKGVGFL